MEKSLVEKIFDSVNKHYDKFLSTATFGLINKWQNELIDNTPNSNVALDIGTGTGEVLKKISLKNKHNTLFGVDLSFNMLKTAKEKINKDNVLFIKADALNLPFKKNSLDSIYFSLVFRHLPRDEIIKHINEVLKSKGTISILEIGKPENQLIYRFILFFVDKIFRPFGRMIFSKEEWDYFVHSIRNSLKFSEIKPLFEKKGFNILYMKKRFFGLVHVVVLQKN